LFELQEFRVVSRSAATFGFFNLEQVFFQLLAATPQSPSFFLLISTSFPFFPQPVRSPARLDESASPPSSFEDASEENPYDFSFGAQFLPS